MLGEHKKVDNQNQLFGDAKATAHADTGDRKTKVLSQAKENFESNKSPQTQAALAKAYFDIGRYIEAESLLKSLIEEGNPDLQLLCDLGFIYKNLNETDKAIEIFKKLVEASPKHALARCAENELWQIDSNYKPSWVRK